MREVIWRNNFAGYLHKDLWSTRVEGNLQDPQTWSLVKELTRSLCIFMQVSLKGTHEISVQKILERSWRDLCTRILQRTHSNSAQGQLAGSLYMDPWNFKELARSLYKRRLKDSQDLWTRALSRNSQDLCTRILAGDSVQGSYLGEVTGPKNLAGSPREDPWKEIRILERNSRDLCGRTFERNPQDLGRKILEREIRESTQGPFARSPKIPNESNPTITKCWHIKNKQRATTRATRHAQSDESLARANVRISPSTARATKNESWECDKHWKTIFCRRILTLSSKSPKYRACQRHLKYFFLRPRHIIIKSYEDTMRISQQQSVSSLGPSTLIVPDLGAGGSQYWCGHTDWERTLDNAI